MLLASLVGIVFLVRRLRGLPVLAVTLLLSPALVVAGAMASSLNLGVRHLLPVTPFLAVAGGIAAARLWRIGRKGRAVVGIALGWLVAGTLLAHPDELAYSNEMAGGPSRTWRALADSNVDWGQSLPALAHEIGRHPLRRLYLGYLGTAEPQAYGLSRYHWIPSFGMVERRFLDGPDPDGREWIAISVTNLLEVYTRRHDGYAWLRERPLTALPGHSIALFDITGDGEAHRRIGESAIRFGEPRAAEAPLRRALELAPEDGRIHLDLARVLATLGRWPEAVARCDDAERLLPESAEARELCERLREEAHRVSSEGSRDRPPPTKPQDRP